MDSLLAIYELRVFLVDENDFGCALTVAGRCSMKTKTEKIESYEMGFV